MRLKPAQNQKDEGGDDVAPANDLVIVDHEPAKPARRRRPGAGELDFESFFTELGVTHSTHARICEASECCSQAHHCKLPR